jgi:putative ABC transport system substrate-binding protein
VPRHAAFIQGLSDLGYVHGQTILIDVLSAGGKYDQFPDLAVECARLKPEIIVAHTTPGAIAAKNATSIIPIIFGPIGDPVGTGIVASLARPGGNVTGQTLMAPEISSKRLQLLKETVPTLSLVAVLAYLSDPIGALQVKEMEQAAGPLGLRLQIYNIKATDDLPDAFEAATRAGAQGLVTTIETFLIARAARIADLAIKHRLPAMYPVRDFVDAGGLMSYGPNSLNFYRYVSVQVDKILKGSKPADMPIEQPTKFEFTVSLKAAKALGVIVPPTLLARADEVIE